MRRLFCLLALIGALIFAVAPTYAGSPDAPGGPSGKGKVLGIVPTIGNTTISPLATNLSYHNGPVMHTNRTYAIYWVPSGFTLSSTYQSIISTYFQNVAADSGRTSNLYYSTTQYYDNVNGHILYSSSFGGAYVDTNPFPASACSDGVSQTTVCLSDAQLQSEISRVITLKGWPRGPANMYFMFTAKNVGSCISGQCAFAAYCAYHSSFSSGASEVIYANMPYADTVASACDAGQHPNGNDADATLNVTSHEHAEAITDYNGNAWWDNSTGEENGDKCAWTFGTILGSTSFGQYNEVIGTGKYYLQREWSNARTGCVQTGT